MTRGDDSRGVFWAQLSPRSGAEQQGRRPVVIVSHDGFNQIASWHSTIVVSISTSAAQAKRGPTVAVLPQDAGGLPKPSVALCHQVTTLDRAKLTEKLNTLAATELEYVERAFKTALDLG